MVSKTTVVAPIGAESDEGAVLSALGEFPAEAMVLLASPEGMKNAERLAARLNGTGVSCSVFRVRGASMWHGFYRALQSACRGIARKNIVVNVSTADSVAQCALMSAAHVNGLRAVAVIDGKAMRIPIMNMPYGELLSESKMKILRSLDPSGLPSLEAVSKKSGMSLQLVSYHVNGSPQSKGLIGLALVEATGDKGRVKLCLSHVGRMFLDGHMGGRD
jgi:hypothetical protein